MSLGAHLQLDAVGPQDAYLRDSEKGVLLVGKAPRFDPELVDRQSSRWDQFEIRNTEEPFVSCNPGYTSSLVFSKDGDYVDTGGALLRVSLPAAASSGSCPAAWKPFVGAHLLKRVRIWAGDQLLDEVSGRSLRVLQDVYSAAGHRQTSDALLGGPSGLSTSQPQTLYVPLRLLRRGGGRTLPRSFEGWFPMAAAHNTQLRLEIDWAPLADLVAAATNVTGDVTRGWFVGGFAATVMMDRAFFAADGPATALIMAAEHTIMIETVQETEEDAVIEYGGSIETTKVPQTNVTARLDSLNSLVKCLFFAAEDRDGAYLDDAILSGTVMVGSKELFDPLDWKALSLLQRYQRTTSSNPAHRLGVHSFALYSAADALPCGALNFSAVTRPSLKLQLRPGHAAVRVRVFALLHRFLRVRGGMVDMLLEP